MLESARKLAARSPAVRVIYQRVRAIAFAALTVVSPATLARIRYRLTWGQWPDFRKPVTFDEKLLWLNLYWLHPLKAECGDKYTLRRYVEERGLGHLLPHLFGVYSSVAAIKFEELPKRFVLKCTHGCKANVFCFSKQDFDVAKARQDLSRWMRTDYSKLLGELHYAAMKRRIICEELFDDGTGQFPTDYKVYCFNGRPAYVMVCTGRSGNGGARFCFADLDWNPVLNFYVNEAAEGLAVTAPAGLQEMLDASRALAAPFPFVRIDFYSVRGRVFLGEMTFTPDACIDGAYTANAQQEMGRRLSLPGPVPRPKGGSLH